MAITDNGELKTAIADWLLRTDLTSVIPDFIALAEARLRRDKRVRQLKLDDTFTVDAESETLPSDFISAESLYIKGDNNRYLEAEIVSPGTLQHYQNLHEPTGTPRVAAIIDDTIYFAPTPDQSYDFKLAYWAGFTALDADEDTNWILTNHPDIYLYGSLIQSAPYMRDDERIQVWGSLYERALEELQSNRNDQQFSGALVRRVSQPIP